MPSDPEAIEQVKAAFGAWLQQAGSAVVDPGVPLRSDTQVSNGNPTAAAEIGGYSIIEAPSVDAAAEILKSHPYVARRGTLQLDEAVAV
jgi:YCII-related domain